MQSQNEDLLDRAPLLSRLMPDDLRAIGALARKQTHAAGAVIFYEGDAGDSFYVIVDGMVGVTVMLPAGTEKTLALLGPGDCFGELSLLDGNPRSATATALRQTVLLSLNR